MKLLNGLPIREINTKVDKGTVANFAVSTEAVNDLISHYLETTGDDSGGFYTFDSYILYYVPTEVFEDYTDEQVLEYIRENMI